MPSTQSEATSSERVVYGLVDSTASKAAPPERTPPRAREEPYFRLPDDATSLRTETTATPVLAPRRRQAPTWMTNHRPMEDNSLVPTLAQHRVLDTATETCVGHAAPQNGQGSLLQEVLYLRCPDFPVMLARIAAAGLPTPADTPIVIPGMPTPYARPYSELPPAAQQHFLTHPVWAMLPKTAENSLRVPERRNSAPHPLSDRPLGTEVDYPLWQGLTLPCYDPVKLKQWAAFNAAGLTPHHVYGYTLCSGKRRNARGVQVHNDRWGVFHPQITRERPTQPHTHRPLCHMWTRNAMCDLGRTCTHQHSVDRLPDAICLQYLKRGHCVRGPACRFIHGIDINDPTGKEMASDALPVRPDTVPDVLTDSPIPPPITDRERSLTQEPVWVPNAVPTVFAHYEKCMTNDLYGTPPTGWWEPTPPPPKQNQLEMAFDKLLQLVSNKRVAPPEVGRWIMDNGLSNLATRLGRATEHYDENLTSLCDDGRPISAEHRPRKRKLDDDYSRIADHLWYTVRDRSEAINRQLDELVRHPEN